MGKAASLPSHRLIVKSGAVESWPRGRGHRARAHTADVIVEAWGPSRSSCLEESVLGLVSTFAEIREVTSSDRVPVRLDARDDEELLVSLLDEVIYLLDTTAAVPIAVSLAEAPDGVLAGWFETVPGSRIEIVGAIPKGVSRSGLTIEERDGQWCCRVEIDV